MPKSTENVEKSALKHADQAGNLTVPETLPVRADVGAGGTVAAIRCTVGGKARKARDRNEFVPNEFRPLVQAKHRLRAWTTPYGRAKEYEATNKLGAALVSQAYEVALAGTVEKTNAGYGSGLLRWAQFGDKHDLSEEQRMPADEVTISAFVGEHRGKVSRKTVKSWLSGIRKQHEMCLAPWLGDSPWVKSARRTANREGAQYSRPPRPPVTKTYMQVLHAGLDLDNPFDAAVWACAMSAFWGCRRLGKLTVPAVKDLNGRFHPLWSTFVKQVNYLGGTVKSATFHVPWTKMTREEGATVVLTGRGDVLCPIKALRNHMRVNARAGKAEHMFAYESSAGAFTPLVKAKFLDRCNRIWKAAGLDTLQGHGFRIGGTTEMLLAGVDPNIIATVGGWTSLAFLLYWRKIEEILPVAIAGAYSGSRIRDLVTEMELFRVKSGIPKRIEVLAMED